MVVFNLRKQYPIIKGIEELEFNDSSNIPNTNRTIIIEKEIGHCLGNYNGDLFHTILWNHEINKDEGSKVKAVKWQEVKAVKWAELPEKYGYKTDNEIIIMENNDYLSEKSIESFDSLDKIIERLSELGFRGYTGYLNREPAFLALKKMIK